MFILRSIVILLLQMSLAYAEDTAKINILLQQYKVVKHDKKEILALMKQSDSITPGEAIEYKATYHNVSNQPVLKLKPILPIPLGYEYLPGSARPANVEASIDKVDCKDNKVIYAPVPLRRKVKLDNGQTQEQEIPPSEYRCLRWSVGDLAANQKISVSAKAIMPPVGQVVAGEGK